MDCHTVHTISFSLEQNIVIIEQWENSELWLIFFNTLKILRSFQIRIFQSSLCLIALFLIRPEFQSTKE